MFQVRRAVPDDAARIWRIAGTLRYEPPGSDRGFLVHVRSEEEYRRILDISRHSFVPKMKGC